MSPDDISPLVIFLGSFFTFTVVMLFRPITKKIGTLLEAIAFEKRARAEGKSLAQNEEVLLGMDAIQRRLDRIDYRLEKIERETLLLNEGSGASASVQRESQELTALKQEVNALLGRTGEA